MLILRVLRSRLLVADRGRVSRRVYLVTTRSALVCASAGSIFKFGLVILIDLAGFTCSGAARHRRSERSLCRCAKPRQRVLQGRRPACASQAHRIALQAPQRVSAVSSIAARRCRGSATCTSIRIPVISASLSRIEASRRGASCLSFAATAALSAAINSVPGLQLFHPARRSEFPGRRLRHTAFAVPAVGAARASKRFQLVRGCRAECRCVVDSGMTRLRH